MTALHGHHVSAKTAKLQAIREKYSTQGRISVGVGTIDARLTPPAHPEGGAERMQGAHQKPLPSPSSPHGLNDSEATPLAEVAPLLPQAVASCGDETENTLDAHPHADRVKIVLIMPSHLQTLWRPAAAYSTTMDVYNLVSTCHLFAGDQAALWRAHKRSVGVAGKVLEQWQAHTNKINDIAWIPFAYDDNGRGVTADRTARGYLATCGEVDHTVKLWRVQSCCDSTWNAAGGAVESIALSKRTSEVFSLAGHSEGVRSIACLYPAHCDVAEPFRTPKFMMASCSNDKSARVWDPWTGGDSLRQIGGCVEVEPSSSLPPALQQQQEKAEEAQGSTVGHDGKVLCITHLPLHGYIATGGSDKVIMLWRLPARYTERVPAALPDAADDFEQARFVGKLEGHRDWVRCIVAVPNPGCSDSSPHRREYMASGSDDKSIFLWDFSTTPPERVRKLRQHTDAISCLAMIPPRMNHRRIMHPADAEYVLPFAHDGASPQQLLLVSGSHDGAVRVWDLCTTQVEGGTSIRDYRIGVGGISRTWVLSLAVYPARVNGETLIISGHQDKTLRVWSLENSDVTLSRYTPGLVRTLGGQPCEVDSLAILPGGLIATGSAGGTLRIIA